MVAPSGSTGRHRSSGVTIMAIVFGAAALTAGTLAIVLYTDLTQISPCYAGWGRSACPAEVGIDVAQLGRGEFVRGAYTYQFLVAPEPPPALVPSALSVQVVNESTGHVASLAGVTLDSLDGALLVSYGPSGSWWVSSSSVPLAAPSILVVDAASNLTNSVASVNDTVTHVEVGLLIR